MFVGLEIRSNSIFAIRVNVDGAVSGRALRPGRTTAVVADALRAVGDGAPQRIGVAARASESVAGLVAAAAGAARVGQTTTVSTGAAVALGEQWQGAARGASHVVSLWVDDHVHGGIAINGQAFPGAHNLAGDVAWLALNPVERDDYRRLGCLEAEISASGIARRLVWRLKTGDTSRALELAGGKIAGVTAEHVFDAAREGDGVAISVVRDTARYVGMAVANIVAVIDPEVIVLGGVIASAADLLLEPSRAEAVRRMSPGATPKIVAAVLGDEGAAFGAARAAMLQG